MRRIENAFSHLNLEKKWLSKDETEWKKKASHEKIISSEPYKIDTYDKFIEAIAQISFYNRDHVLFYRGQKNEHKNEENEAKIFPQIFREENRTRLEALWVKLEETDERIKDHFKRHPSKFAGTSIFLKYRVLRWAIMQHYLIEKTPLLDITHSSYVAASFAQHNNEKDRGIVYILGMPSLSNTIDVNTEEELVLIRLLSFCLPQAKRPYLQEAYAVGPYPYHNLEERSEVKKFNFSRRLIAKFSIPTSDKFWGDSHSRIPDKLLNYQDDSIDEFLKVFQIEDIRQ